MPDTTCHMSISLDGFVAGPDQSREDPLGKRGRELHGWHIGDPRANDADKVANEWLMRPRGAPEKRTACGRWRTTSRTSVCRCFSARSDRRSGCRRCSGPTRYFSRSVATSAVSKAERL